MESCTGNKLLLTSVCKPFGTKYGDGFGVSFEGTHQIMWAQGIFRTRGTTTQWGLDFIAANLDAPTTTLHYPTMARFIKEIKKGYDYIGIAFVSPTLHKMIPMVKAIREHAPASKIVLGGYGTALGDEVASYGDHFCRGEGVAFMRELLGEPLDRPINQPMITQDGSLFSMPILRKVGYVFAGLGCPNGCDFCATSHYFKREHIRFLPDGPSILDAILRLRETHPNMTDFWINDEDFLLSKSRGRGFLEAIRESDLPPISLSIFSSVKALSQFKASELVEMGIDWVWVGFEGKRAGYAKMEGRSFSELFADMHGHGISMLASMIIGFDYQTPAIIQEEFEDLMSMEPTMSQFLIYGPAHGTPAFAKMKSEGRLDPETYSDHSLHDGFTLGFNHPHIDAKEMSAIQHRLYHAEFARLGPSIFRTVNDWLTGYENLREHPAPRVRAKAEMLGRNAHLAMMLIPASKKHLDPKSASRLDALYKRLAEKTGPMTLKERIGSLLAGPMLRYTSFKVRHDIGQQPSCSMRTYRTNGR